ncbi:MAG: hypothetical protein AAF745_08875, partial [Planctomycetota bacterium]
SHQQRRNEYSSPSGCGANDASPHEWVIFSMKNKSARRVTSEIEIAMLVVPFAFVAWIQTDPLYKLATNAFAEKLFPPRKFK